MKTKVDELPDSKVRLEIEVPEDAVEHALEHAASDLAGSIKVPRLPRVRFRSWSRGWDATPSPRRRCAAISKAGSGTRRRRPESGRWPGPMWSGRFCPRRATRSAPWRPSRWHRSRARGLDEPRGSGAGPRSPGGRRRRGARADQGFGCELGAPVTGRSSQQGDTVVLDLVAEEPGAEPSEHRDYVVEARDGVSRRRARAQIPGMVEGDTREVTLDLGEDSPSGKVTVTLKEIKEKVLPGHRR